MDSQIIATELSKLEDRNGRLTPEAVVEAARSPNSPLHDRFEWDNSKAGDCWRLEQARRLIRYVTVEIEDGDVTFTSVAYVHDPSVDDGEQGYRSIKKLKSDRNDAFEALVTEFDRLAAGYRRAHDIGAALGYGDEIDKMAKRAIRFKEKIERKGASLEE